MIVIKWKYGDVIYVRKVGWLYSLLRKYFMQDKLKIRVRRNWQEPIIYDEYYQEDCTLIYRYEVACVQKLNDVPICISKNINSSKYRNLIVPLIQVSLYNVQIVLDKTHTLTIPTSYFSKALEDNSNTLKLIEDRRKFEDAVKFQKYKGSYFKKQVDNLGIKSWKPVYCSICGKPVEFEFLEDKVVIHNNCECKTMNFPLTEISYDEFSLWYTNQVVAHKSVEEYYKNVWFKKRDVAYDK